MPGDALIHLTALSPPDFRRVMEEYAEDVWYYAYFLTKNKEAADDLAQETFVKAFKCLDSFRGEASVKTWLMTIVRNTWYTHRRSAFIRKVVLVGFISTKEVNPSAEADYLKRMMVDDIWQIVMRLPVIYREVLILQAHYELSMEEMASLLNLSVTAVKSRLRRARKMAAAALKEGEMVDEES
ncbi:RNA polymerase sigma factor [Paenibacillus mendelii]|uniref:RNA polymerase sigma factor n=1 Tax=Paenibacillus mendelii TaxID=206163 RepID=A0ABV6JD07_9BACL|nr:RNA polymerase sigma factor [Paenibacillus mendelii]MCQ6562451.1 RNA polymerase sigma factor [Paenibacillus mendelii]